MRTPTALLLAAALCGPLAAAETLTWQEANRQSAERLKRQNFAVGADLAKQAFDLYGQAATAYDAKIHAQLLLNAVDARLKADGHVAAASELIRGTGVIDGRQPDAPILIALYEEGINIARNGALFEALNEFYERSARLADRVFGDKDPRAILIHSRWASEQYGNYFWSRNKLTEARNRAAAGGALPGFLAMLDLGLARLELSHRHWPEAIKAYTELIDRLEQRADPRERTLLQTTYAQLMYSHERLGDAEGAERVRQRLARSFGGDNGQLVPLLRVEPQWPAKSSASSFAGPGVGRGAIGDDGSVVLEVTVATDGTVRDVQVLEASDRDFAGAAVKAMRDWKFKPRIVDGQPVEQKGLQRFDFKIKYR